jgi:hypothetical protein
LNCTPSSMARRWGCTLVQAPNPIVMPPRIKQQSHPAMLQISYKL